MKPSHHTFGHPDQALENCVWRGNLYPWATHLIKKTYICQGLLNASRTVLISCSHSGQQLKDGKVLGILEDVHARHWFAILLRNGQLTRETLSHLFDAEATAKSEVVALEPAQAKDLLLYLRSEFPVVDPLQDDVEPMQNSAQLVPYRLRSAALSPRHAQSCENTLHELKKDDSLIKRSPQRSKAIRKRNSTYSAPRKRRVHASKAKENTAQPVVQYPPASGCVNTSPTVSSTTSTVPHPQTQPFVSSPLIQTVNVFMLNADQIPLIRTLLDAVRKQ